MSENRDDRSGRDETLSQRSSDVDDKLDHAPEDGNVLRDYFSFDEVFARVLSTADHELAASNRFLFLSGLGAGAALGLTFLARVIFTEASGEVEPGLVGNLLYPVGFLIIVLGRYQLFTENTLTPVVLVLTRLASVMNTLRLWGVVLLANMIGALAIAAFLAFFHTMTFEQETKAIELGRHSHEAGWFELFSKGIIAGWIVAAMVWLVHSGRDSISKIFFVYVMMYFVGTGGFYHVITSAVEVFYLAFKAPDVALLPLFPEFVLPVLIGNTIGGITFVAVLNYTLFAEQETSDLFSDYGEQLSVREWIFGIPGRESSAR